MAKHSQLRLNS